MYNRLVTYFGIAHRVRRDAEISMYRRTAAFALAAFAPAMLALVLLASCARAPDVESASLTGEDWNRSNDEVRVYFENDSEPIVAILDIVNIRKSTKLETVWRYMTRGTIIYESSEDLTGDGLYRIRLNRKLGESELGDYRIDVSLDGRPQSVLYFTVMNELRTPPTYDEIKTLYEKKYGEIAPPALHEGEVLTELATASSVYGLTQAPKDLADKFYPDTPVVYLTMFMNNAPEGTKIRVDWLYLGADGAKEQLIIPAELATGGTRQLAFNMKPGAGDLPVGKYEARVYLNDAELKRVPFSVVEDAREAAEGEGNDTGNADGTS